MGYHKIKGQFLSANGEDTITYYIYRPQKEPNAILQLSHGMCEYVSRYLPLADFLSRNNIMLCGNDHLGHGESAKSVDDLGFFAHKKGNKFLAEDLHTLTELVQHDYPITPFFLLGHSMGSFIARSYCAKYGDKLSGAIFMGTSGKNPAAKLAIVLAWLIRLFKGERYRSPLLKKLAFGNYNKRIKQNATEFDWLSTDHKVVEKYINDPYCNFTFTASGFWDLSKLLNSVSSNAWVEKIPKELPIYLLSGEQDPVGRYGVGVTRLYNKLKKRKLEDVSMKLYKGCRHEPQNEPAQEELFADIVAWISSHTGS